MNAAYTRPYYHKATKGVLTSWDKMLRAPQSNQQADFYEPAIRAK